ncbi:hypothetical protein [Mycobacterium sp. TY815]|uniref:hypothetical protein n=1 Tax=Mycobacterium sp. TY815 TaxID=3050581 RepID=UPI0027429A79|nr:hypothetical protein [Mycobacterium sp. TY815]MDP7702499.1 hypothetical protein [Mycobacterium sp. TY815]
MTRARQRRIITVCLAALMLVGCTRAVDGHGMRATGQSGQAASARDLLLRDGDETPWGPGRPAPVGDDYFTSVRPKECAAALLFRGSPLRPSDAADYAESAYTFGGPSMYAESISVYDYELNPYGVAWRAFSEVSDCRDDAIGVSPRGDFQPMRVTEFGAPQDDVMMWSMGRPDWTCSFGLVAVPKVVLVITACNSSAGFPMAEWAPIRKAQLNSRVA